MRKQSSIFNGATFWVALFFLAAASAPVERAGAAVISSNLPVGLNRQGGISGVPSDAYLSNGSYGGSDPFSDTAMTFATRFTAAEALRLTQVTFWGFEVSPLNHVAGFHVQIYSEDFSAVLSSEVWTLDQLAIQETGALWEMQYAGIFAGTGVELAGGNYWLNIGAISISPTIDPEWGWSHGQAASSLSALALQNPQGTAWQPWNSGPVDTSVAHILFGDPVPAPGAVVAMVGALLCNTRRRR